MVDQRGSYRYDSFAKDTQVEEFERLYRQSNTLLEIERQLWPGLGIASGQQVLDLGCGSGIITHELAKQVYPSEVTGLDLSKKLLARGRQALFESDQGEFSQINATFQQGSVYQLPFHEESFDIVYARFVFQHLDEPMEALSNIWRILKPGGLLCILDIDRNWSSLYPEPETSLLLKQAIVDKQLSQGGDPWVGSKLGHYLKSSKFNQVQTTVRLIDSDQLGLAKYFEMLSFGGSYQSKQSKITTLQEKARPDVKSLLDNPHAWAGFGLFVVTGRKS
ncbi:MAG: methyltransferase domain-containing protein [Cyanobacteria bacterium J06555_13]